MLLYYFADFFNFKNWKVRFFNLKKFANGYHFRGSKGIINFWLVLGSGTVSVIRGSEKNRLDPLARPSGSTLWLDLALTLIYQIYLCMLYPNSIQYTV